MTLLIALFAANLLAAQPPADIEREARALEGMLIAPCCFSQQVSVHQSPAADEVRKDVRARLAAGQTRQQILDAYVGNYGKRILAEPPAEGFDRALYLLPPLLLLGSAALVIWLVRRFSGRATQASEPAPVVAGGNYDQKLDDELRDLD